jgi:hypothetical protein
MPECLLLGQQAGKTHEQEAKNRPVIQQKPEEAEEN